MTVPRKRYFLCILGSIAAVLFTQAAFGQPSFTITLGSASSVQETVDTLERYPATEYATATPWRDRVATYRGVLLSTLLDGREICENAVAEISAQNGYVVRVELQRLFDYSAILAYQMNEQPIPIIEKGPFAILFPYHQGFPYLSAETITLSVWYVSDISLCK